MATTSKPTISTYVSDMLALEKHIVQPLEHQAEDDKVRRSPAAARVVAEAVDLTRRHIAALETRLAALGGHAGEPIKSGVSSALGAVAAAVGDVRKTAVSKYLRDDYSALSLASASYTLLHTTALAFGDAATAEIAKAHLADTATLIMRLSGSLPSVVLAELRDDGVAIDPTVAADAERNVERAWKDGGARSNN